METKRALRVRTSFRCRHWHFNFGHLNSEGSGLWWTFKNVLGGLRIIARVHFDVATAVFGGEAHVWVHRVIKRCWICIFFFCDLGKLVSCLHLLVVGLEACVLWVEKHQIYSRKFKIKYFLNIITFCQGASWASPFQRLHSLLPLALVRQLEHLLQEELRDLQDHRCLIVRVLEQVLLRLPRGVVKATPGRVHRQLEQLVPLQLQSKSLDSSRHRLPSSVQPLASVAQEDFRWDLLLSAMFLQHFLL